MSRYTIGSGPLHNFIGGRLQPTLEGRTTMLVDPSTGEEYLEVPVSGRADVVFGSRFMGSDAHRVVYFWHMVGNRFLTLLSNMMTNINLTDMETCYKVMRREVLQKITLNENRFGFEPEITAKVARRKCRIYEVGIS